MTANVKRKLAAILAADAYGYSRMMGADEEGTLRVLAGHRAVIDGIIALHEGRIVGTAGDSVLAEFESAVEAVRCAVETQDALKTRNDSLPEGERMLFRIGVNLGDVMVSGDDLHGDGVNVAARLESIAEPGGVCISSSVYDQITGKLNLGFVDIGDRELKNIARPIHVYQLAGTAPVKPIAPAAPKAPASRAWAIGVTTVAVIAVLVAWQAGWFTPATPAVEERAKAAAELAKARAETDEAKRRAETESAASAEAKRQLEAQRASEMKARGEAELAKARADAEAIRRKADAELAAARLKQEQLPKAAEPAPKPAEPVVAAVPPAPAVALAPPAAAASRYDGNWKATRSCVPFEEFPTQVRSWQFTATGGELIVSYGQPGQPGYMTVRGKPGDDGSLVLAGKIIAGAERFLGQEGPAYFEGRFDGERFVLKGRLGRRACTLVLARAGG
jgi:class 3 adenylate cyclase